MIKMKAILNEKETLDWIFDEISTQQMVKQIAIRVGYHPAGYGMFIPRITFNHENDNFVATWERLDSCD